MTKQKEVKEMTREELEKEVTQRRYEYIWGLQAEDFAMSHFSSDDVDPEEIFLEEDLSNEELTQAIYKKVKESGFYIHEWSEIAALWEFDEETKKHLKTMAYRYNLQ